MTIIDTGISAMRTDCSMKFQITVKQKIYTLSPSFVEIDLKVKNMLFQLMQPPISQHYERCFHQ